MTLQEISGDFAKASNFTEQKSFTSALSMFMVVDNQIWNIPVFDF